MSALEAVYVVGPKGTGQPWRVCIGSAHSDSFRSERLKEKPESPRTEGAEAGGPPSLKPACIGYGDPDLKSLEPCGASLNLSLVSGCVAETNLRALLELGSNLEAQPHFTTGCGSQVRPKEETAEPCHAPAAE